MVKRTLKGYQGIFFDKETQEKLVELQKRGLEDIIKDMHITFKHGEIEAFPDELIGKEYTVKIVGYASDGKNSGFQVELPEELMPYYQNPNGPHITVSLGEVDGVKGKAVDTGVMKFEELEEPIEITGQIGYCVYKGKIREKAMDNSVFYTIDIRALAEKLGMQPQKRTLGNGRVVEQIVWDQENLLKAVKEVKPLSAEGKPVRIDGVAPAWLVSALTHAVHPCPVSVYVPPIGKDVPVSSLPHGETNPEGEVSFKVTEKGNAVLVEYSMDCEIYDENNLAKVVVPEIPQGKAVYISGKGPNYLTVSIAEAYAHTNSSVSLNQSSTGYTCSITHSRAKNLGDLTRDPMMQEEVREQLKDSAKDSAKKEGPAID